MNIAFNFLRTDVCTFASHTSPNTDQSLQKCYHHSYPDKIELKNIPPIMKTKKTQPNNPTRDKNQVLTKNQNRRQ